jgi:hypothetical protein
MAASAALGLDAKPTRFAIVLEVTIHHSEGSRVCRALFDTGAERNFISQLLVKEENFPNVQPAPTRILAVDGKHVAVYGRHILDLEATDCEGETRRKEHTFEATDIHGYDIILGYPWALSILPVPDWEARTWRYPTAKEAIHPRTEVVSAEDFLDNVRDGEAAFLAIIGQPNPSKDPHAIHAMNATIEPSTSEEPSLPKEYEDYTDVFSAEEAMKRNEIEDAEHPIDLLPGKDPPYGPIYNLSARELSVLREYIHSSLDKGWIAPSRSPAGAPILFAPKKDGSLRLCVDYRGLNALTIKNRYPLPLIGETIDRLAGAKVFTHLDLRDAYHRIRIRRGDEWKTAFRTRYGHFEYRVMPFGLTNAPATFQAYINRAMAGLLDVICVVYLDDILIYSRDPKEHAKHVRMVLERLRAFRLYAKLSKCRFNSSEVSFLGFRISTDGVSMEPDRVATIMDWPTPESFNEVQVFLGFANFYRRFIEGYSRVTRHLTDLLKGSVKGRKTGPFRWTERAEKAFQELKTRFTTAPILRHFIFGAKLRMECDASDYAASAILSQLCSDGQWHPIAFWSRKLDETEIRYETHDKELLAIVAAFKHWRHYLEGSTHPIKVRTDHLNLRPFMTTKELTRRQARWAETLAAYDFVIEHCPGRSNPADAPSRRPDYEANKAVDYQALPTLQTKLRRGILSRDETLVQEQGIAGYTPPLQCPQHLARIVAVLQASIEEVALTEEGEDLCRLLDSGEIECHLRKGPLGFLLPRAYVAVAAEGESPYGEMPETLASVVRRVQQGDAFASQRIKEVQRASQTGESAAPWRLGQDGLLRHGDAAYIPPDPALRQEIIRLNHDDPAGGHLSARKTLDVIRRKYFWDKMSTEITEYKKTCDVCQRNQTPRHRPYGELQPLGIPTRPWETMTLDFITGLPPSRWNGQVFDSILVCVDAYTKTAHYFPCRKTIDAPELAILLIDNIATRYGMPKNLVSDRASLFTSKFWSTLCYYLKAKRRLSTAFHPQTDGQTERQNQMLEHYLRCYCSFEQDDWASHLSMAEFTYNNAKHSSTGMSPFEALYAYSPDLRLNIEDDIPEGEAPAARERVEEMHKIRELLEENLAKAIKRQKKYYDKEHAPKRFAVGDQVLLKAKNLRSIRPSPKLNNKFAGPFVISDIIGTQAYRLRLPPIYRSIHPVFHVSLLEPYHCREGEEPPDHPIIVEGEEEWHVEAIRADRIHRGKQQFLVKWEGFSEDENTWEPVEHLDHADEALAEYRAKKERLPTQNRVTRSTRRRRQRGKT